MHDIFLSYATKDFERVRPLAQALTEKGWSVFWDRNIAPGESWRNVIGAALRDSRCVVVIWSKASVESTWVQEEAEEGRERGILCPVAIDDVRPPLGFRCIQAAKLVAWSPRAPSAEFDGLIGAIGSTLGQTADGRRGHQKIEGAPPVELSYHNPCSSTYSDLVDEIRLQLDLRGVVTETPRDDLMSPELAPVLDYPSGKAEVALRIKEVVDEVTKDRGYIKGELEGEVVLRPRGASAKFRLWL